MVKEIFVKSQEELDDISAKDNIIIIICFGTRAEPAIIKKSYRHSVIAYDDSSVRAYGNDSVEAFGNSSVEAFGNSSVIAYDDSSVIAYGNNLVITYDNSSVEAYNNSSVEAYGNSSVEAYDDSSVIAYDNVQVLKANTHQNRIEIFGNARIVYTPKNIIDFMKYHNINQYNDTAIFYKAVHKKIIANRVEYLSDFDSNFTYEIGKKRSVDFCNRDPEEECAEGIHISTKDFAVRFGMNWDDLAILEVKAKIGDIVVPNSNDGKVRVSEVEVIREVPLEECGLLGKMFLRMNGMKEGDQNE